MADDPFDHPATPPRGDFVPPHLDPLSLRTAVRFAYHLIAGVGFLGGIFLLLALVLAAGAVIMMVWESMPLGEAVYFVLITALTIGYGDITPQTDTARIVTMIQMAADVTILVVGVRLIVNVGRQASEQRRATGSGGGDGPDPT